MITLTHIAAFRDTDTLEKARHGRYADTAENRRLHRVGQEYGKAAQEDPESGKKPQAQQETEQPKKERNGDSVKRELELLEEHKDSIVEKYGEKAYNKKVESLKKEGEDFEQKETVKELKERADKEDAEKVIQERDGEVVGNIQSTNKGGEKELIKRNSDGSYTYSEGEIERIIQSAKDEVDKKNVSDVDFTTQYYGALYESGKTRKAIQNKANKLKNEVYESIGRMQKELEHFKNWKGDPKTLDYLVGNTYFWLKLTDKRLSDIDKMVDEVLKVKGLSGKK